jgi:hypothetical protein
MKAVSFYLDAQAQSKNSEKYDHKARMVTQEVIRESSRIFHFTDEEVRKFHERGAARIICSSESFVEWQLWRESSGFINRFRGMCVRMVDVGSFPTRQRVEQLILVERV